jgi:hypothetical protein
MADEEVVHYKGEGGGMSGCGVGRARKWMSARSRVGTEERQGEVGIKAPTGEDQAQFFRHHRRRRVCRGCDGGKVEDRVW